MNKLFPLFFGATLALLPLAHADEQTRDIQSALKDAGFYYGQVNGEKNEETAAAIRRYQIRNGLQVTGSINQETLDSLFKTNAPSQGEPSREPSPTYQPPQQQPAPAYPQSPESHQRIPQEDEGRQDDREMLRDREVPLPPGEVLIPFSKIFHKTPFDRAPLPVQQQTVRRVQDKLAEKGFYRGRLDGQPTEKLRRAIVSYQQSRRLKPSGDLDMETLHHLRLLPGESDSPFSTREERPQRRIYRGIEVR